MDGLEVKGFLDFGIWSYQQVHEDEDGYDERNQMVCESVE